MWFISRGCEWTADPVPRIAPGEPFGDGEWIVGSEVAPGLYVASELANPGASVHWEMCEWTRLGDFRGGSGAYAYARLAAIAEIGPANAGFRSSRCGEWTPYRGPAATPGQPFGDGVFLVGAEIAPGPYRAAAPSEGCRWERLRARGAPRWPRAAMDGFSGDARHVANVAPTDLGFASRGCGTWQPVPIASFGDGEHRVGADIPPGRYRASAPTEECEWERRDAGGVTGFGDSSIPVAEAVLDLGSLDRHAVFASSGCGTWTNDPAPRIAPGQPFGDGAWFVGPEVAPGLYRAADPPDSCRWLRLHGFHERYDRDWERGGLSPNVVGGRPIGIAEIRPEDAAFVSNGCGTWTLLSQPIAEPGEPFGDGTYVVGLDIAPGRYRAYRATAPDGSLASCYWARLTEHGFRGEHVYGHLPSPLADGEGRGGMAVLTVDIAESDAGFFSRGCGTWTADLTPAATPGEPFGDGEWIVGVDIAPGRYRASSPSGDCRWYRLYGFRGRSYVDTAYWARLDVIGSSRDLDGPGEVTVAPSDLGFASRYCGEWTPAPP